MSSGDKHDSLDDVKASRVSTSASGRARQSSEPSLGGPEIDVEEAACAVHGWGGPRLTLGMRALGSRENAPAISGRSAARLML